MTPTNNKANTTCTTSISANNINIPNTPQPQRCVKLLNIMSWLVICILQMKFSSRYGFFLCVPSLSVRDFEFIIHEVIELIDIKCNCHPFESKSFHKFLLQVSTTMFTYCIIYLHASLSFRDMQMSWLYIIPEQLLINIFVCY